MPFEPVVLFFVLGAAAGFLRSDLKLPAVLYEALAIYLLLAIGLKGGVELARHPLATVLPQAFAAVVVAIAIPLLAFPVLRSFGKLSRADAASIAAHYGSVSVVTFAVGSAYLAQLAEPFEGYMAVFVALLEFPALLIGVVLARRAGQATAHAAWGVHPEQTSGSSPKGGGFNRSMQHTDCCVSRRSVVDEVPDANFLH